MFEKVKEYPQFQLEGLKDDRNTTGVSETAHIGLLGDNLKSPGVWLGPYTYIYVEGEVYSIEFQPSQEVLHG